MPTPQRTGRWLVGVAIVLLAVNLRPAVGSVGVVLEALRGDLGMSVTTAGLLTTLPVLCFAAAGIAAHSVIAKLGLHVTTVLVLMLAVTGVVVRSLVDSPALFLVFSVVALSGARSATSSCHLSPSDTSPITSPGSVPPTAQHSWAAGRSHRS